jgi:hypothetical protein
MAQFSLRRAVEVQLSWFSDVCGTVLLLLLPGRLVARGSGLPLCDGAGSSYRKLVGAASAGEGRQGGQLGRYAQTSVFDEPLLLSISSGAGSYSLLPPFCMHNGLIPHIACPIADASEEGSFFRTTATKRTEIRVGGTSRYDFAS